MFKFVVVVSPKEITSLDDNANVIVDYCEDFEISSPFRLDIEQPIIEDGKLYYPLSQTFPFDANESVDVALHEFRKVAIESLQNNLELISTSIQQ